MPTFCRHNRFVENCPICSDGQQTPGLSRPASPAARRATASRPGSARHSPTAPAKRPARRPRAGLTVRRVARAADDGYAHELVPGLRASEDARRLAEELAFSAARLRELRDDPPGLYADVAESTDKEEATWLAFLIAYFGPLDADDPWAGIRAAARPWSTGELPNLEDVVLGPRTAHDPKRGTATLTAYRAWAQRAGSQQAALAGESALTPQRRFDRAFERLALPGLARAGRYEFLVLASHLGVADVEAGALLLGETMDPTTLASKRVFGMGDAVILRQRSAALASELELPIGALDLGLVNWARPEGERITAGATVDGDDAERDRLAGVLGVS